MERQGRGNGGGAGARSRERRRPPAARCPPPASRRPPPAAHPAAAARCDGGSTGHRHPRDSPSARPAGMPENAEPGRPWPHSPATPDRIPLPPPAAFPHNPPDRIPQGHRPHCLDQEIRGISPRSPAVLERQPRGKETRDAARRSASGPGLRAPPPRRGDRPRPTRKPLGVAPRLPVRHIRVTGDSKSLASIAECSPLCRTSRTRGSVSRRHLLTRLDAPERGRIRP